MEQSLSFFLLLLYNKSNPTYSPILFCLSIFLTMLKYPTGTEGQAHKLLGSFLFPTGHASAGWERRRGALANTQLLFCLPAH